MHQFKTSAKSNNQADTTQIFRLKQN